MMRNILHFGQMTQWPLDEKSKSHQKETAKKIALEKEIEGVWWGLKNEILLLFKADMTILELNTEVKAWTLKVDDFMENYGNQVCQKTVKEKMTSVQKQDFYRRKGQIPS